MRFIQKDISLRPKQRGFHLVTSEILQQLSEIKSFQAGLLFLFLQHTSASLSTNENADATVRTDFESFFSELVTNKSYFLHTYEGEDDMPGHIKSSLLGVSQTFPIRNGKLHLGTWQGIYFCEHRDHAGSRKLFATILGEEVS
ncbi:MAG: secondary thiamine-phosphate synthase enzyme YjbQ [Spirochaetota bacterium]